MNTGKPLHQKGVPAKKPQVTLSRGNEVQVPQTRKSLNQAKGGVMSTTINLSGLDPERQKCYEVLNKLKSAIAQVASVRQMPDILMLQENQELSASISQHAENTRAIKEEHEQKLAVYSKYREQMQHIEVLNMMSKYQLIYIKLETGFNKLASSSEARQRLRLKRGFQAFKTHTFEETIVNKVQKRRQLVCTKFELSLNSMVGAFTRYQERVSIGFAFRELKLNWEAKGILEGLRKQNLKKISELQQELVSAIKKVDLLNQRSEEIDSESASTKKRIQEQQRYKQELEERQVRLNTEHIQLLEKQNSGTQERINVKDLEDKVRSLESQVGQIEGENRQLQQKLDSTTMSIGSFVSEVNMLMDQHEVNTATHQNMDVESGIDYEEEDEYMDEETVGAAAALSTSSRLPPQTNLMQQQVIDTTVWNAADVTEYDEVRPHAGTGGSSKLKSRPNQLYQVSSHPQPQGANLNNAEVASLRSAQMPPPQTNSATQRRPAGLSGLQMVGTAQVQSAGRAQNIGVGVQPQANKPKPSGTYQTNRTPGGSAATANVNR